ncbi:MAG: response regulator [Sphingobacteriales bacterium]|nr:MAG: response regulator [Sphingobacteriales bacterium]
MAADPYILMLLSDIDDQQLTAPMIEELATGVPVHAAANREDFFHLLETTEPMLALLDFNSRPDTGLDLLERIRREKKWAHLPIVLLGDSRDAGFIRRVYSAGANSYVVKPSSLAETRRVIGSFFTYWLQVAETPNHNTEPNVLPA